MHPKELYRNVTKPEEIPNPNAPILEIYMRYYGCDIVSAYNRRMEEIRGLLERERKRLANPRVRKAIERCSRALEDRLKELDSVQGILIPTEEQYKEH